MVVLLGVPAWPWSAPQCGQNLEAESIYILQLVHLAILVIPALLVILLLQGLTTYSLDDCSQGNDKREGWQAIQVIHAIFG